jgi:hypothetical protein
LTHIKALNGPFAYAASNNIFVNLKISFIPSKSSKKLQAECQKMDTLEEISN